MPIYEYRCDACGRTVEVFARTSEDDVEPASCGCGKPAKFTKVLSTFAVAAGGHVPEFNPGECCGGGHCGGGMCGMHDDD